MPWHCRLTIRTFVPWRHRSKHGTRFCCAISLDNAKYFLISVQARNSRCTFWLASIAFTSASTAFTFATTFSAHPSSESYRVRLIFNKSFRISDNVLFVAHARCGKGYAIWSSSSFPFLLSRPSNAFAAKLVVLKWHFDAVSRGKCCGVEGKRGR